MPLRFLLVLLCLPATFTAVQAQFLPRGFSPEELALPAPQKPLFFPENAGTPPPVPVRSMAEWEELQALVVTWNQTGNTNVRNVQAEIVRTAREECRVIVCCNDQNLKTSAQNFLVLKGVDISSNVEFLVAPTNSIWVRDFGPNTVYGNDVDSLYLVDWIYNRPRYQDDAIPAAIGNYMNIPVYATTAPPYDLVNTGGNFMADGVRTGFSSRLVLTNNDQTQNGECGWNNDLWGFSNHDEAAIDNIMQEFMGIERYIKMEELPYDCIKHIDMHMKLLDEETLLVGEYPAGVADGPQIEANIQYVLNNYVTAFNTPYKVIRMPMPPDFNGTYPDNGGNYRTFVNAMFVNKTVLVPFYETQYDTIGQRIWEEALPGYRIVGINSNALIGSSGAIHCITREIGVADPLRIVHQPLQEVVQSGTYPGNYPVHALIQHRSGIASARVWYTTDTSASWQFADMTPYQPADTADVWVGLIPRQDGGQEVFYYIEATANSGKSMVRPMPAPNGWWKFSILFDVTSAGEPENATLQPAFPNPASAITCVPVHTLQRTRGSIRLLNMLGQTVSTLHDGEIPAGTSRYFFHAGSLPAGTYVLHLQTGEQQAFQKIIVHGGW